MSSEAVAWAFKLDVKPSSVKFTLVALCECANYKTGRITPSVAHLCEITGQDRKTVIANVAELERRGIIADTGERCGATKQIKVYNAAIGTVPETEQFQKRNGSENGRKQSQKRDTEPSLEPSTPIIPKGMTSPDPEQVSIDEVLEGWNSLAAKHGLAQIRKLTALRRRKVQSQAKSFTVADWQAVFAKISQSPFLKGENRQGWRCDFDFILSENNFVKILEGKYDRQ